MSYTVTAFWPESNTELEILRTTDDELACYTASDLVKSGWCPVSELYVDMHNLTVPGTPQRKLSRCKCQEWTRPN